MLMNTNLIMFMCEMIFVLIKSTVWSAPLDLRGSLKWPAFHSHLHPTSFTKLKQLSSCC